MLRVSQLSVDHDLNNQTELQRLLQLGLDVEKIRQVHLECFLSGTGNFGQVTILY